MTKNLQAPATDFSQELQFCSHFKSSISYQLCKVNFRADLLQLLDILSKNKIFIKTALLQVVFFNN